MVFQKLLSEDFDELWGYALPWEELNNSNIMVTGASGLIGSFFIYALLNRNLKYKSNIHIIALARRIERLKERFDDFPEVEIISQDVCEPIFCSEKKLDYILHAACDVQPKTKSINPVGTCKTIVEGMFQICELAKKVDAKVILLSSIGIYGVAKGNRPFEDETVSNIDLANSAFAYNEGKRLAEMICASYAKQYGLEYSVLRIGRVYGPTMNKTDSMVLSSFLFDAATGKNLYLKSKGTQEYTYVYVADVIAAIFILMFNGECTSYNCGEGEEIEKITLGQIAEIIARENNVTLYKKEMNALDKEIYSNTDYCVMTSNKLMSLGWKKHTMIQEGIKKTSCVLKKCFDERQYGL